MPRASQIFVLVALIFNFSFQNSAFCQDEFLEKDSTAQQCEPDSMQKIYEKYEIENPDQNELKIWYSFGSEYVKHEEYNQALPYLWKVFANDSAKLGQYSVRKIADCYFSLKMADSTLLAGYLGLEKFPDLQNLHYYAGIINITLGKYDCAIPHYEYLIARDSTNEAYLDKLASLYFNTEDERSIEIQRKLVSLYPDNPEYSRRLIIYLEHFDYNLLDDIREAFKRDSNNVENGIRLAQAEYDAGNYEQAVVALANVLKQEPENTKALKIRAQSYEGLRKYLSSIGDYKTMLKIKPDDMDIMCAIATQYKLLDRYGDGAYWAKLAISKYPGKGLPHIVMAELYEASVTFCQNQGNRGRKIDDGLVYEKAIDEYKLALADPAYTSYAKRRIELLEPFRPTTEEIFFNPDKKIKYECYTNWIDTN